MTKKAAPCTTCRSFEWWKCSTPIKALTSWCSISANLTWAFTPDPVHPGRTIFRDTIQSDFSYGLSFYAKELLKQVQQKLMRAVKEGAEKQLVKWGTGKSEGLNQNRFLDVNNWRRTQTLNFVDPLEWRFKCMFWPCRIPSGSNKNWNITNVCVNVDDVSLYQCKKIVAFWATSQSREFLGSADPIVRDWPVPEVSIFCFLFFLIQTLFWGT